MTANVSITVGRKDEVLMVPNAAFRFSLPPSGPVGQKVADSGADVKKPSSSLPPQRPKGGGGNHGKKTVWKVNDSGDPASVAIRPGISDGSTTEVVDGELRERDKIIIGIVLPKGERTANQLPPGFGSGQKSTSSRDRGLQQSGWTIRQLSPPIGWGSTSQLEEAASLLNHNQKRGTCLYPVCRKT